MIQSSMRLRISLVTALTVVGAVSVLAQGRGAAPAPPPFIVAPDIPGVVKGGTRIELVKGGIQRTEGPVGMPDGSIVFTETNRLTRIDAQGNATTFVDPSNSANGLGFDPKGRMIAVQRGANNEKVGVLYPPDAVATLVDSYEGKPFNRLNDLVVSTKGAVYFTDTGGVYYLPPGGNKATRVVEGVKNPKAVILSPDEKTLYVNDKDGLYLLGYDVQPNGLLANKGNFAKYQSLTIPGSKDPLLAEDNGADGLAVDGEGRVYIATNLGVEVFSPKGMHLGTLPVVWGGETFQLRKPQNLAFAGPDKKTLYIVGAGAVYKVQMLAQGFLGRAK